LEQGDALDLRPSSYPGVDPDARLFLFF